MKLNRSRVKIALVILSLVSLSCTSYYRQQYEFYNRINDWEAAEKTLCGGLESDPDNPEIHFLLGRVYGHWGKFEEMDTAFQRSLAISVRYKDKIERYREFFVLEQLNKGIELYNQGSYRYAVNELSWVGTISREETGHHKYLGLSYSRLEEFEMAKDFLVLSVDQNGDLESKEELARVYSRLSNSAGVIEVAEELLDTDPNRIDFLNLLASAYEGESLYSEAVSTYYRILELETYNTTARYNLALLLSRLGRKEEAVPIIVELSRLEPENRQIRNTICSLLYDIGKYEESLSCFMEYLDSYPDDVEAMEYMFILSRELNRWEEAKRLRAKLDQKDLPDTTSEMSENEIP
jgi:tetratricopeptide (TPR) repeat protein